MAGGVSYLNATVKINSATTNTYDVTEWTAGTSGDVLWNYADARIYPQAGATVRCGATIGVTSLDLSIGANKVGGTASAATALAVTKNGSGSCTFSLPTAVCTASSGSGSYGALASWRCEFATQGSGGTEPTLTWGSVA